MRQLGADLAYLGLARGGGLHVVEQVAKAVALTGTAERQGVATLAGRQRQRLALPAAGVSFTGKHPLTVPQHFDAVLQGNIRPAGKIKCQVDGLARLEAGKILGNLGIAVSRQFTDPGTVPVGSQPVGGGGKIGFNAGTGMLPTVDAPLEIAVDDEVLTPSCQSLLIELQRFVHGLLVVLAGLAHLAGQTAGQGGRHLANLVQPKAAEPLHLAQAGRLRRLERASSSPCTR